MKTILILGAGHSTPYLISDLLDFTEEIDARVIVADRDLAAARQRVGEHTRGEAIAFDVTDVDASEAVVANADVVVNLLPPSFQVPIARVCLHHGKSMISASYQARALRELDEDAKRSGVLLLTEMGLDPGIDLMTAKALIDDVTARDGRIDRFVSYGAGLPDHRAVDVNPLRYVITWNPRNVVMAGEAGAAYLLDGKTRLVPWHRIFETTWWVDVPGIGTTEAYPNRDSTAYRDILDLPDARTLIRGTLRFPGYAEVWRHIIRLGYANEALRVDALGSRTWAELAEMFIPAGPGALRERLARFLGISPTGTVMERLEWLGLLADETIGGDPATPAEALARQLGTRLARPADVADLIILHHELDVRWPDGGAERIISTLTHLGDPGGVTAMARTVGLPAALATRKLLGGELDGIHGAVLPTDRRIYEPILEALADAGLRAHEESQPLPDET
ncbi:MAG: saccharopine dehydrogenase C-terminal domain-containing protein [Acidobacteriota bacterium]